MGASRPAKKRGDPGDTPSVLPPPPRESLPTLLLLQPRYFEQLFALMHTLSAMKTPDRVGVSSVVSYKNNFCTILKLVNTITTLYFI